MTDKVINLDTDKEIEYYEQDLDDAIRHGSLPENWGFRKKRSIRSQLPV